jgi:hypothetical protein
VGLEENERLEVQLVQASRDATGVQAKGERRMKWELIDDRVGDGRDRKPNPYSERIKVPGGWLVRTVHVEWSHGGVACATHTVFVPGLSHEWSVE